MLVTDGEQVSREESHASQPEEPLLHHAEAATNGLLLHLRKSGHEVAFVLLGDCASAVPVGRVGVVPSSARPVESARSSQVR